MRRTALRATVAVLLGAAAAALVACGSSGSGGLIPASVGGPLQADVEAVEQAAQAGNGNCTETESALAKTKQDFGALPSSVNSGLRDKIRLGIENLEKVAKEACAQPLAPTRTATTPKTGSSTTSETQTTPPPTTSSTTKTTPPPVEKEEEPHHGPGGGTPAPGESEKTPGEGVGGATPEEGATGHGNGNGNAGGNGNGGAEGGK